MVWRKIGLSSRKPIAAARSVLIFSCGKDDRID
jgi:hypothetical protein